MSKIVAFTVPSLEDGDKALEALEDARDVDDVALVYKNDKGKVKLRQTSDVGAGKGAVRGALLGATVGLFAGPVAGAAVVGGAGGGLLAKLGDRGVDNKLMKMAGEQLEGGHGAVFVMAEDAKADAIAARIKQLTNLKQYNGEITVGAFPADAQKLVKEQIKAENEA